MSLLISPSSGLHHLYAAVRLQGRWKPDSVIHRLPVPEYWPAWMQGAQLPFDKTLPEQLSRANDRLPDTPALKRATRQTAGLDLKAWIASVGSHFRRIGKVPDDGVANVRLDTCFCRGETAR